MRYNGSIASHKQTPKNLAEAIAEALNELIGQETYKPEDAEVQDFLVRMKDRLAQSFAVATFSSPQAEADAIMSLWHDIFPKR